MTKVPLEPSGGGGGGVRLRRIIVGRWRKVTAERRSPSEPVAAVWSGDATPVLESGEGFLSTTNVFSPI